ncbi:PhzF family phenazine biosynthesis protein [Paenibacillus nasutitermitis]|uniref:Phenazine biosynthesis protein n=1 Tax=Paenibacillus nasutitermitis TaxID=1652958 RepID=A0A917DP68_9BACL|nr:PhzF family phenazine biosynthesis protein [Paenibacillus nasutitermitis]GGD55902.1 phenazine biosynthesis protein [Paenibacillus nasutitermitis]
MTISIHIIDAFTNVRFKGNPAAVCLPAAELSERQMQQIAAEMNLSETAFLLPCDDGSYSLRWFTPLSEVDLCGHATLASAHYLWENGKLGLQEPARFHTRSGLLGAERIRDGIRMDFPSEPVVQTAAPEELIHALGLIPRYVGRNRMDYLVEVDSEETVRSLRPDFALLARVDARGIIVTSRSQDYANNGVDFVSRAYFPSVGVNEDPVTGSAHCALAPYWQKKLRKDELRGYQASDRGGYVQLRTVGERVFITGQAVTVLKGIMAE